MKLLIIFSLLLAGCTALPCPRLQIEDRKDIPPCVKEWMENYWAFDELLDLDSDCTVEGDKVCCCREQ